MLLTGPFAMLSMPSFDFHLPPCTEGFLIHLSPLWQLPLWQLPLFPSVAQFPCVHAEKDQMSNYHEKRPGTPYPNTTYYWKQRKVIGERILKYIDEIAVHPRAKLTAE